MRKNLYLKFQYLIASAVVICSLALGALVMGALAGGGATADAANPLPKGPGKDFHKEAGSRIEKRVSVGRFNVIEVSSAIDVVLTQAEFPGYVEVAMPEKMAPYLDIKVVGGKLSASYRSYDGNINDNTVIKISVPFLSEIHASAAASVKTSGSFSIDGNLLVSASSAADINFGEITGPSLSIHASNAADVYALVVDVDNVTVSASSAADVKLRGMNVGNVTAKARSAADIVLSGRCNRSEVDASSGADIKTRGLIIEKMPIKRMYSSSASPLRHP